MRRRLKRSEQINVRATPEDLKKFEAAAAAAWPGAILTLPSIVLSLARIKAEEILNRKK